MTDKELVERLNAYSAQYQNHGGITAEAADRIEQLRAELTNERIDNTKLYPKIHPTQKPVKLLKKLIRIFTDIGDVVIDPCAGSGSTLRAAYELGRSAYGFEVDKGIYTQAKEKMIDPLKTDPAQMDLSMAEQWAGPTKEEQ